MSHDHEHKLDVACMKCVMKICDERDRLLRFVNSLAFLPEELKDPEELWDNAKTVQDGIDYTDHFNAKIAREFLKELGYEYEA